MKYEYIHDDGDDFIDYSWEIAPSIYGDVYSECLLRHDEFFFLGEKVLTLPKFAVLLGLYEEYELNHGLFAIHFTKLEVDDKLFNHEAFWQKIGKPTSTNPRTSLIKEPLMRIVHKLMVGSLVHRGWVIAENLCKNAPGLKENSIICGGHYVTKIAHSLGYLNEEEVAKYSKPIEQEGKDKNQEGYTRVGDIGMQINPTLSIPLMNHQIPLYPYPYVPYPHPYMHYPNTGSQSFGGDHYGAHGDGYHVGSIIPSSGYEIGESSAGFHGDDFDPIVHLEDCVESDDDEMRD
ncbi:hypothetical protein Tco_1262968 [Tanacetum coccineum]